MENQKKIKVAIGMSGGVDSSVSALLLKEQGYDVVGLFMKLWHDPCGTRENACCDEKALLDARTVANQIGIPLYVVDVRQEFKEAVTDYFIEEYKHFRTPNPCVVCNKKIKFGWMVDFAQKLGCDFVATGHYCRIKNSEAGIRLLKGKDEKKDQSYFLYQLNQEQLSKIIFPVGEMTKNEVRAIAKSHDLPVHERAESQEICFVEGDYRDFLRRHLERADFKPGEIVDEEGNLLGQHNGLVNYTIGQAKGITQNTKFKKQETKKLYVLGFDSMNNRLIVGEDREIYKSEFTVKNINWIDPETEHRIQNSEFGEIKVKIRYKAGEIGCTIKSLDSEFVIRTSAPVRALTPGQSAVFYFGDEVLGGGIILE